MYASFWTQAEQLVAASTVVVERPKGSVHPRFGDMIYPLDYGYLAGTAGGDGAEVDVWLGSLAAEPPRVVGAVATVDPGKRDLEAKLLLNCTPEECATVVRFFEGNGVGVVFIARE